MANPRSAKFTTTPVLWSDGSNFNGFAVIALVFPTASGVNWPELTIEPGTPRQRLPIWHTVPIVDGVFNQALGLWYNTDINPPNTKYAIWYYDTANKLVAAPSSASDFFTVTDTPVAPTVYTLTVPIAGTAVPSPS